MDMDSGKNLPSQEVLRCYEELRDATLDLISANPKDSLNVHGTYMFLCKVYDYPLCDHYVEYLKRYTVVQAAISKGLADRVLHMVRRLDFTPTYVGKKAWLPILVTLSSCVLLHSLSLSNQQLDSGMVLLLTYSLPPLVQLSRLDLSGNPIGCTGVQALIRLARASPALVYCNIHGAASIAPLTRQLQTALADNQRRASQAKVAGHE